MPTRYWVIVVHLARGRDGDVLRRPHADLARAPGGRLDRRAPLAPPRRAQERVDLGLSPEPRDAVLRELGRVAVAARALVREGVAEEGVRVDPGGSERLAVPVPQLLAGDHPAERAHDQPRRPDPSRKVEPDDGVRAVEHEVAELAPVRPVDHPRVERHQRLDTAPELGPVELGPAGLPVDRVELDERHVEGCCEGAPERRLPTTAGRREDRHTLHGTHPVPLGEVAPCT